MHFVPCRFPSMAPTTYWPFLTLSNATSSFPFQGLCTVFPSALKSLFLTLCRIVFSHPSEFPLHVTSLETFHNSCSGRVHCYHLSWSPSSNPSQFVVIFGLLIGHYPCPHKPVSCTRKGPFFCHGKDQQFPCMLSKDLLEHNCHSALQREEDAGSWEVGRPFSCLV